MADLRSWESSLRPAGYAIVTGVISGRITFDFDGPKGAELVRLWGIHPHRKTGRGGFHWDITHPGWYVPTLNGKAKQELGDRWEGLDVKGDGGYAIAMGRNQTGEYQWLRDPDADPFEWAPTDVRRIS
jgi:hypothetical protein